MKKQRHISIFLIFFFALSPLIASAAVISLNAVPASIGAGDTVQVTVFLDSTIATNAFSGTLLYPGAMLEPIAISDGNSIISMWITRPTVTSSGAPITFAGITPGGFSGNNGILFSILFRATAAGTAKISLNDIEVLRNDGAGGNEPTATNVLTLSVGSKSSGGYVEPVDHTSPEPFTALLGTDPQLFDGKAYLVFTALDKGSGVDHYVVAESRLPSFLLPFFPLSWGETASPYVLANQNLTSTAYLKAVDRAGNEQLSIYPPQHLLATYEKVILLVILVAVVLLWRSRWGRRLKLNP